ncbi:MAG: hypothetical protein QGI45_06295 [Myxococcota bacterium]|jgi:hypothetical protein|nr:hypothetical protein [Myxococcota bacterium]
MAGFQVFVDSSQVRSHDYRGLHAINRNYMQNAFMAGEFSFWSPYLALGKPFATDIESGIFYPFNWLFLVFLELVSLFLCLALLFATSWNAFVKKSVV